MFCSKCGNKLYENEKFCSICGEKVLKKDSTALNSNEIESPKRSLIKIIYTIVATLLSLSMLCISSIESYAWVAADSSLKLSENRMFYFSFLRMILIIFLLIFIFYYFSRKKSSRLYSILIFILALEVTFSEKIINLFLYQDKQLYNNSGDGFLFILSGLIVSGFSILLIIDSFKNYQKNNEGIKKEIILSVIYLFFFTILIIGYLFIPKVDLIKLPFVAKREAEFAIQNQAATLAVKSYNQTQVALISPTPRPTKTPTPLPPKFEDNSNVKMIESYLFDGKILLAFQNLSDTTIKTIKISTLHFDKNGYQVIDRIKTYTIENINLIADDISVNKFYYHYDDGKYIQSIVKEIEYMNGSEYKAKNIELWESETLAEFNEVAHKNRIREYGTLAGMAEINPYISFSSSKVYRNYVAQKDDLNFYITNLSNKTIVQIDFSVLEYDINNYPISVNPYEKYYFNNTGATFNNMSILPNQSHEGYFPLFFQPDCENYKVVVDKIIFTDGSTWRNENLLFWILFNSQFPQ